MLIKNRNISYKEIESVLDDNHPDRINYLFNKFGLNPIVKHLWCSFQTTKNLRYLSPFYFIKPEILMNLSLDSELIRKIIKLLQYNINIISQLNLDELSLYHKNIALLFNGTLNKTNYQSNIDINKLIKMNFLNEEIKNFLLSVMLKEKKGIIFAGSTSSGKTTLLNSILNENRDLLVYIKRFANTDPGLDNALYYSLNSESLDVVMSSPLQTIVLEDWSSNDAYESFWDIIQNKRVYLSVHGRTYEDIYINSYEDFIRNLSIKKEACSITFLKEKFPLKTFVNAFPYCVFSKAVKDNTNKYMRVVDSIIHVYIDKNNIKVSNLYEFNHESKTFYRI